VATNAITDEQDCDNSMRSSNIFRGGNDPLTEEGKELSIVESLENHSLIGEVDESCKSEALESP